MFLTLITEEEKMSLVKRIFDFFSSPKKEEEKWKPPTRTKEEVLKEIKIDESILNSLGPYVQTVEQAQTKERAEKRLLACEKEFIEILEDFFDKAIAEAATSEKISLLEFFKDDVNRFEIIRGSFNGIARYLDPVHPLCIVPQRIGKKGKEILLWLLSFGVGIESVGKSLELISRTISTEKRVVDVKITNEEMQSFFLALITTSVGPEYGKQFRFLLDVSRNHFERLKEIVENPQI
ncbi:MAG: hypothetical protein LiPW41_84 [Parcubacteria group bacterium LiPW_41]|nr:MAG: hypothetical protein LiPW41_84 [Parcubacteria group bacterium LiPW_41]